MDKNVIYNKKIRIENNEKNYTHLEVILEYKKENPYGSGRGYYLSIIPCICSYAYPQEGEKYCIKKVNRKTDGKLPELLRLKDLYVSDYMKQRNWKERFGE